MDLSIIIVNYNVKYFLEQCLFSVNRAVQNIEVEIIVVDNNSVDGSCEMIKNKFPDVRLIDNKENLGFSKANNQALKIAKGEFCLLLNPDTVVEEDTFEKCINFMRTHEEAGALGVYMIDGKGNFLPESKRALPTPLVAFYKIFGLSSIFPHSSIFGKYNLGYLDNNKIHEVDILSGAYMFIRKKALAKTGLLDESFFMYGEDIDLSYRFIKSGFKNYYFPETSIIHYKGESTKKGSINYVLVFYKAMIIFAKKHFSKKNARSFSFLINLAIYFRAFLSIIRGFWKRIYQILIDFLMIFAGFYFLTPIWENYKFGSSNYYPPEYINFIVPSYILLWLISLYYSGAYEKPVKLWNVLKGHVTGTLLILVLYALLPENLRFSRAIILLGSLWVFIELLLHRLIFNVLGIHDYEFANKKLKKIIIIGSKKESDRVNNILSNTSFKPEIIGYLNPEISDQTGFLGNISQINEVVQVHKIDELIFCSEDMNASEIIKIMTWLSNKKLDYKIAPPESLSIIGSNSINTAGDFYIVHFNSITEGKNKRIKRLFDIISSLLIILFLLFPSVFKKKYSSLLISSFKVLWGKYTWISFNSSNYPSLPKIKSGIFDIVGESKAAEKSASAEKIILDYARDYNVSYDYSLLWKNLLR